MKIGVFLSLLFLFSCNNNKSKTILLLVESNLYPNIEKEINTLKEDLINEKFNVVINSKDISKNSQPNEIKSVVLNEFDSNENLTGAIFIGNIKAPLYNTLKDQGDAYWHDYLADFYYMDFDGVWIDSDNNGVLDNHKDSNIEIWSKIKRKLGLKDNRAPEIWVSRIKADKLTSLGAEEYLIKEYLHKNHAYRNKNLKLPPKRAFLIESGVNLEKSDWGAYPKRIYSDIYHDKFHATLGDTLRKVLNSSEGYELGIINVFSGPRIHHFNHFFKNEIDSELWKTKEGRIEIAKYSDSINDSNDVSWKDVKEFKPKVLFYHLLTSEVGRHDFDDYLGGMYLFSGMGLVAIAGTQHSGAVGTQKLYNDLADGKSFGQAWQESLIWLVENEEKPTKIVYYPNSTQIIKAGKSLYKAVLLGDGSLNLPK